MKQKYFTPQSEIKKWKVGDKVIAMNDARGTGPGIRTWWRKGQIGRITRIRDYDQVDATINGGGYGLIPTLNEFMLYEDYLNIQKNIALIESL